MSAHFNNSRQPRRLRYTNSIRAMVKEHRLHIENLIMPVFITDMHADPAEIDSLPNIYRYGISNLNYLLDYLEKLLKSGIKSILLFGVTDRKNDNGSSSWEPDALVPKAIEQIKKTLPELYIISDICFCSYTSSGRCGIYNPELSIIDNSKTLENLKLQTLAHARSGVDMVAPSGMIDGMVLTIRNTLDKGGFDHIPIMSYSVKYSSSFYGPFREAVSSSESKIERADHQMDFANAREAIIEAEIDIQEGADIIMVKPATAYLDIVHALRQRFNSPIACYHVSGAYAMIKAASAKGWIDEISMAYEVALSCKRAGADIIITYFAQVLADYIQNIQTQS